jgi:ankyrin repeat protein
VAFHLVSASGSVDSFKLLLDKGTSFILTDTDDYTPLHISALQRVSQELDYRIDICRVTKGAHMEHL